MKRTIASSATALALVSSGLMAQPATATGSTAAADGMFGPDVAVAGLSLYGHTYIAGSSDSKLNRISFERVDATPSIVVKGGTTHLLSVRAGRLIQRTEFRGWRNMTGTSAPKFSRVNATLSSKGSTVHAVALGTNGRAYYFSYPANNPSPTVNQFEDLGGSVYAPVVFVSEGPAAPGLRAGLTVFARGTSYSAGAGRQNIYGRNLGSGSWVPLTQASRLMAAEPCTNDHSVATDGDLTVAACGIGNDLIAVTWRRGTATRPDANGAYLLKGTYRTVPTVTVKGNDVRMAITRPDYSLATTTLPLKNMTVVPGAWKSVPGKFRSGVSAAVER